MLYSLVERLCVETFQYNFFIVNHCSGRVFRRGLRQADGTHTIFLVADNLSMSKQRKETLVFPNLKSGLSRDYPLSYGQGIGRSRNDFAQTKLMQQNRQMFCFIRGESSHAEKPF